MKITHYYLDVGQSTMPKNNLEKEFAQYLRGLAGILIKEQDLETLKNGILTVQDQLNAKYSRCKPLAISFYTQPKSSGHSLHGCCQSFTVKAAMLTLINKLT